MEDILAVTLIFGGGAAFLLAISPIGKAIAYRIKRIGAADGKTVEDLLSDQRAIIEELEAVKHEIADIHERMDFTERLLTDVREKGRLGQPQDVQK